MYFIRTYGTLHGPQAHKHFCLLANSKAKNTNTHSRILATITSCRTKHIVNAISSASLHNCFVPFFALRDASARSRSRENREHTRWTLTALTLILSSRYREIYVFYMCTFISTLSLRVLFFFSFFAIWQLLLKWYAFSNIIIWNGWQYAHINHLVSI